MSSWIYSNYYSAEWVSNITKQATLEIEVYHKWNLSDKFFCVCLDATYLPLHRQTFEHEAVYIVIGIKSNGQKEIIDYCIASNENIKVWKKCFKAWKIKA